MNKKLIRLTESDLHRIVKRTINELTAGDGGSWANHSGPQVYNYIRDQVGRTVMSMMQECQKYINNNDETALSQLYWLCSSFTDEYDKAFKDGNEIYGGMNFRK
jgi:hypothetical protein